MNWGELGEDGTQFLFVSPGLDLLGRGEHILIWTGTLSSHYMPCICDACFYNLCSVRFALGFLKLLTISCPPHK